MFLEDLQLFCEGACQAVTAHGRALATLASGAEELAVRCRGCLRSTRRHFVHFAYRMRCTACGLALDGQVRRVSQQAGCVDCPECLEMVLSELSSAPIPDWRPDRSIAEDAYAL